MIHFPNTIREWLIAVKIPIRLTTEQCQTTGSPLTSTENNNNTNLADTVVSYSKQTKETVSSKLELHQR